MTLAIIDGDIVAFRAAAAACKTFNFGDDFVCEQNDPEAAAAAAVETVATWAKLAKCKDTLVCFTGPKNFRKLVLPSYKAHRTKGKPPVYWSTVDAVKERFETRVVNGLEADDVMGIMLTTEKYREAICCTIDKDLRTVPGRHFNPIKDRKPSSTTLAQGDYWWLLQSMMGDVCDGYKGIPRVGDVKARAILGLPGKSAEAMWPLVVGAYRNAKLTEEDALVQARVARILRREDYDRTTKEIILWHPRTKSRLSLATVCA